MKSIKVDLPNGDAISLNYWGLGVYVFRKCDNGISRHVGNFNTCDGNWFWEQMDFRQLSVEELEVILGWMKKDPFKVEPTFSELTLSNGDRSIVIHVWTDDRITIADDKSNGRHWGSAGPSKQTVIRWIKMQLHGDLSQEPEFVRIRLAGIRHRGHSGMISGPNPETDDSKGDIEP